MRDLAFDHWDDLLKLVLEENGRQLDKWGYQNHDPFRWMVFLTEEVGELAAEIADNVWGRKDATDATVALEAIQVATLALKIAEMHLYRRQSEAPDLTDPTWREVSDAIREAHPGQTIEIVMNLDRYRPYDGEPEEIE